MEFKKKEFSTIEMLDVHFGGKYFHCSLLYFTRYAATPSGVLFAFPGSPMLAGTDPTRQNWYLSAHHFPNGLVLSRPRLDIGGAGYIVTLSKLITLDDPIQIVSSEGKAVMGMDLTMGYIYNMVLDTMPICNNRENDGVRCFLFDQEGYLIAHPSQFEPDNLVEQQHLTHVEHLAASRMLADQTLVKRIKCKRYSDLTIQHYYVFNTSSSHSSFWTNQVEDCLQYQVSLMPGTNVFLGIVMTMTNCSLRKEATFCPCNVNSNQCILCNENAEDEKSSSSSCECPCECAQDQCDNTQTQYNDFPLCPPRPQTSSQLLTADHPSQMLADLALPACFDTDCGRRTSKNTCFGVIGCSWCEVEPIPHHEEADHESGAKIRPLIQPFCSEQEKCFAGVLGAPTPYDKLERGSHLRDGDKFFFRPTPSIGPIAGAIVAAILFLGLSAYCLRNHQKCASCVPGQSTNRSRVGGRHGGSSLQVANFEEIIEDNDNPADELHELGVTHKNIIMNQEVAQVVISPYRMNPGYRRPPAGTDSDHGYSTMTPMGDLDSEIIPYTESASARERLHRMHRGGPPSSIQSVTSGVSSRTSSPVPTAASVAATAATLNGLPRQSSTASSEDAAAQSPIVRGATTTTCKAVAPNRRQVLTNSEGVALLSESSEDAPLTPISLHMHHPLDPETMLPRANKNQFVVAATVHMVDST
jgi:hypothetical protein